MAHDPAKVEQLWSPDAQGWFPGGPTDPDLALLAVEIRHAKYWDVEESRMKQLFNMAKAALTGEHPPHMSGHEEVNMTRHASCAVGSARLRGYDEKPARLGREFEA